MAERIEERSSCCNRAIIWQKGSYMGEHNAECYGCGRRCNVETIRVKIPDPKPTRTLKDNYPPDYKEY